MSGPLAARLWRWRLPLILLAFLLMQIDFLLSDLWFDELITLEDFVRSQADWRNLLRHYPLANHHMLFTTALWFWDTWTGHTQSEWVLRLPCVVAGAVAVWWLYLEMSRMFGRGAAAAAAAMLAMSPVFQNFTWQLRGYSFSIALGTVAATGAVRIICGRVQSGLALFVPSALLLPGILPTNLLVNLSLCGFVATAVAKQCGLRAAAGLGAIVLAASTAGMLIYLPVWREFWNVVQQTETWPSGWLVSAHWLLALVVHAGPLVLAASVLCRTRGEHSRNVGHGALSSEKHLADVSTGRPLDSEAHGQPPGGCAALADRAAWLLVGWCLIPLLAFALWRAPMPRALLGYLGPLTIGSVWCLRRRLEASRERLPLLLGLLLCCGVFFYWFDAASARGHLERGEIKQNLLQLYYARNRDHSLMAGDVDRLGLVPPDGRIAVEFHFYRTFGHYYLLSGNWHDKRRQLVRLHQADADQLRDLLARPSESVWAVGYSPERLGWLIEAIAGRRPRFREVHRVGRLRLFRLELRAGGGPG